MKMLLLLLVFFSTCASFNRGIHEKPNHSGLSIIQGVTGTDHVEFSLLHKNKNKLDIFVETSDGTQIKPIHQKLIDFKYHHDRLYKLKFESLPTSSAWKLKINSGNKTIDDRFFQLFPKEKESTTFAVLSCLNQHFSKDNTIFESLEKNSPDLILLIGDNHYPKVLGTFSDLEALEKSYIESRYRFPLYYQKKLIPIHAIWDDHDYGMNNGHNEYRFKEESLQLFNDFYAQNYPASNYQKGFGAGSLLMLGGMNFIFLDNRSFRSPQLNGKHFGEEQELWLFDILKQKQQPSWIISGDQFFGGYHEFESFQKNHPNNFEQFTHELTKIPTPFHFVSGDRHMSEIMQFPKPLLGQLSYEITSSPFFAKTYPGSIEKSNNPWRVMGLDQGINFALIKTHLTSQSWESSIKYIGENNNQLAQREISIFLEELKDFAIEKRIPRERIRRFKRSSNRKRKK